MREPPSECQVKVDTCIEALSLDGDNDYVSPGVVQELVAPSAFSVSLWFQRTADHADTSDQSP